MDRLGRILSSVLCVCVLISLTVYSFAAELQTDAASVILMEAETKTVLYEDNADQPLPPASVTKIMTLLLVMEAVDSGRISMTDSVQISEHAASMGGSQIYLEPGECMTVDELIKSVTVASANDAAVALAEYVSGSEEAFVNAMNERAAQLNLQNTHFENTNGLDDETVNHYSSARDIALMSAELMRHRDIFKYTTIWQDTVRGGAFTLTNTNRLIRFYNGATGLKTGSTSKAKFCISATAQRDGLHLIAVVMASPTRDIRNECAKKLLDYGFSNYSFYTDAEENTCKVPVTGSNSEQCELKADPFCAVLGKGEAQKVQKQVESAESLQAPVQSGAVAGRVIYTVGDRVVGECPLVVQGNVEKISFGQAFLRALRTFALS